MLKIETIKNTCESCPAQWEGIDAEGRPVYVRYRWGYLAISVGEKYKGIDSAINGQEVFGKQIGSGFHGESLTMNLKSPPPGIMNFRHNEHVTNDGYDQGPKRPRYRRR